MSDRRSKARPESLLSDRHPLIIVVGSGGVGKTTLAAALGVCSALGEGTEGSDRGGGEPRDTLVMTFDPSLRLKDALGVGEEARDHEVPVDLSGVVPSGGKRAARLDASLLDAGRTFDRLVARYAPDDADRERILGNRFYRHLSGSLAGVLEYMAVERLFEVAREGSHRQVILDTPPTRQALDFLEAPERIVGFLDSGALKIALKPWFDERGRLKATSRFGFVGRRFERFLDEMVGLGLLRDMAEFFQAFEPLYEGFRRRARDVQELLRSEKTLFVLVAGPGEERIADTLFFARRLREAGYRLGPVVVNRVHPPAAGEAPPLPADPANPEAKLDGRALLAWLGERDRRGVERLDHLLGPSRSLVSLPLLPDEPTGLDALRDLGADLLRRLDG